MIIHSIILRFKKESGQENERKLERYLAFLREQKGFIDGSVARSIDDPEGYIIVSKWESIKDFDRMEENLKKEKKINEEMFSIIKELEDPFRAGRYVVQKAGRDDEIINFDKIKKHCRICSFPLENNREIDVSEIRHSGLCNYCEEREKLHQAIKEKLMSEKKFTTEEAERALEGMDK